ncbi:DUF5313 family protein [Actinophytocola xinjiangensis]|uniref:DUF5313 family protein n=1 Tax=Actinophytocola xinjiangensis TaxID=485602 RepID=UPI000A802D19|nr:DUF5313 family protein [Actinophytocola xinjiangensis]
MRRPTPSKWLWYAVGGTLPAAYREWVLYDLTCQTWVLRHLARVQVMLSTWLLVLFLPGPMDMLWWVMALGYFTSLYFSFSFMEDACERRLVKHGFPPGLNRTIREESTVDQRARLASMYTAYYSG